jgi:hypothetical protein
MVVLVLVMGFLVSRHDDLLGLDAKQIENISEDIYTSGHKGRFRKEK